ncbi:sigma-70 family RNA polymerase sigma factor [Winogradskyella sp.]|uniref:RNA polymerase sigma factor n=1 Tax=Winogradskyella sp. TaxID=1883156 RepID=UPI00262BA552|nr:sigma-70 family RNA polymerase sigma factor [Winogradskyella sp.]
MVEHIREEDLQQRLRADDKSALEFIYKSYKSEFLNFSKRYDLNIDDALDIYQDSVIAMYQNFVMNQLELSNSTIKTYLFGIGKHKIYKVSNLNKTRLKIENDIEESEEVITKEHQLNYYQKQLSELIGNISESCRELLRLFYYRNLTIQEIVDLTQYKDANTVKSHKSRCMKRLKSLVKSK